MKNLLFIALFITATRLAVAKEAIKEKAEDTARKPASARCFSKGDQDGYAQALKDFSKLAGRSAGCTRLLSATDEPIKIDCKKSGDYQSGFKSAYTKTMMENVIAFETKSCN